MKIPDVILFLYRESYDKAVDDEKQDAEIIIAKHSLIEELPVIKHLSFVPKEGGFSNYSGEIYGEIDGR